MLLEFASFLLVVQVFGQGSTTAVSIEEKQRETYLSTEPKACPICAANLHGHGWRNRYVAGLDGCMLILVHRKRCPECRMTFTLLPKGLHAFRIHDVHTISKAIRSYLEMGRYINAIPISKPLRKSWVKAFLHRQSHGERRSRDELLAIFGERPDAFFSAPLCLRKLGLGEVVSRQNLERYRFPHHRLLLGLAMACG